MNSTRLQATRSTHINQLCSYTPVGNNTERKLRRQLHLQQHSKEPRNKFDQEDWRLIHWKLLNIVERNLKRPKLMERHPVIMAKKT